jgi:hypothetical protein
MKKRSVAPKATDDDMQAETFSALEAIGRVLTNVVGIGAGLSATVLISGSAFLAIYYSKLGAPWILQLVPVSRVLQAAGDSVTWTVMAGLLGTSALLAARTERSRALVDGVDTWLTRAAMLAFLGYFVAGVKLEPEGFFIVAKLLTGIMCVAAGFSFAAIVLHVANRRPPLYGFLFIQAFAGGFIVAPAMTGWATAQCDLSLSCSQLAHVDIVGEDSEWRLVLAGDTFVVATFGGAGAFRILPPEAVASIHQIAAPNLRPPPETVREGDAPAAK